MKRNKKIKIIIVSMIVLSVIGYLTYTGIRDTMAYFLTVSELLARGPSDGKTSFRVGGEVVPDSVQWDPKGLKLTFRIGDGRSSILVSYEGVVPDTFKPGNEVIVEGKYTTAGLFSATTIMPRCPSKYE